MFRGQRELPKAQNSSYVYRTPAMCTRCPVSTLCDFPYPQPGGFKVCPQDTRFTTRIVKNGRMGQLQRSNYPVHRYTTKYRCTKHKKLSSSSGMHFRALKRVFRGPLRGPSSSVSLDDSASGDVGIIGVHFSPIRMHCTSQNSKKLSKKFSFPLSDSG